MLQDTMKEKLRGLRGVETDDVLEALGFQRKSSAIESITQYAGLFAAGVVVGGSIALLFAPKSGRQMRQELNRKASDLSERIGDKASELADEVRGAMPDTSHNGGRKQQSERSGQSTLPT